MLLGTIALLFKTFAIDFIYIILYKNGPRSERAQKVEPTINYYYYCLPWAGFDQTPQASTLGLIAGAPSRRPPLDRPRGSVRKPYKRV